ncbi:MAG: hypothetical protein FWH50_02295, partial [Coriobacteriia bacterium]|nr:hypothetical protein [Coriobacteriia bacterium]
GAGEDLGDSPTDEPLPESEPHRTSLAAWDIPEPIECASTFTVRVGAKCSRSCSLAGAEVTVYDDQGLRGSGILSDAVLSAELDLYWTDIELVAPFVVGNYQWEARLEEVEAEQPEGDPQPSHPATAIHFGINIVAAAEFTLTVHVIGQDSQAAPGRTRVLLLPYRGYADKDGIYSVRVAPGLYRLRLVADRYEDYEAVLDINGDTELTAELEPSEYETDYRGNVFRVEKK